MPQLLSGDSMIGDIAWAYMNRAPLIGAAPKKQRKKKRKEIYNYVLNKGQPVHTSDSLFCDFLVYMFIINPADILNFNILNLFIIFKLCCPFSDLAICP